MLLSGEAVSSAPDGSVAPFRRRRWVKEGGGFGSLEATGREAPLQKGGGRPMIFSPDHSPEPLPFCLGAAESKRSPWSRAAFGRCCFFLSGLGARRRRRAVLMTAEVQERSEEVTRNLKMRRSTGCLEFLRATVSSQDKTSRSGVKWLAWCQKAKRRGKKKQYKNISLFRCGNHFSSDFGK